MEISILHSTSTVIELLSVGLDRAFYLLAPRLLSQYLESLRRNILLIMLSGRGQWARFIAYHDEISATILGNFMHALSTYLCL